MHDEDLAFSPAWKLADLVSRREVSPVELTQLYLDRIARVGPTLNAYITVCADEALEAARAAEAHVMAGDELPPLHGVPISLKDLELTRGVRTTLGSPALADFIPDHDSVVAERVRRSGAIVIGKTSTPEIGISFATVTDNALAGPCRNPWDQERTTGGSSGGAAAAVAAGLCAIATGSDGGGSIRIPASFCGVYGFKPSHGRVPRAGGFGRPEPNQFAQSGPITRTVRDAAILLQALSGPDPRDPTPDMRESPGDFSSSLDRGVSGLRIGWSSDFGSGAVDPGVERAARGAALAFEGSGCSVEEADISLDRELTDHFWTVFSANAYVAFRELLEASPCRLGADGRRALEMGRAVTGAQYARSLRAVNDLKLKMAAIMEEYDLLLTPTTAVTAFRPNERPLEIAGRPVDPVTGFYPYTFPINMTGQPAATAPCGFVQGLPVGLHLIGRRGEDELVLRASAEFERTKPWADVRPSVG